MKTWQTIKELVLDLIFPRYCVGCKKEGSFLCQKCQKKILLIKLPSCYLCNRLTPKGQVCSRCRSKSNLTGLIIAGYYEEPLKEAIHRFKYDGAQELGIFLGGLLVNSISERKISQKAIIIAVPLHQVRKAQRGFNQAEILARQVGKGCHLAVISNRLIRIKQTKPQIELSGKKRHQNIKGAFAWSGGDEIKNKTIILIDDVCTTGSTLEECSRILREVGAREIWGLVLAKG